MVYGADTSSLATYGVIHIRFGHITAQVRILGISCHLFICTFHVTLWVACVPLEDPLAYNMYLFNLRIANHILIKILIKILQSIVQTNEHFVFNAWIIRCKLIFLNIPIQ